MITVGEYKTPEESLGLICKHEDKNFEIVLVKNNMVYSSFKKDGIEEYSYGNKKARGVYKTLNMGLKGCSSKNGAPVPFELGVAIRYMFKRAKIDFSVQKFKTDICCAEISSNDFYIFLNYSSNTAIMPTSIPYIKLAKAKQEFREGTDEDKDVVVRSLDEISLEKDTTWLANKKYYIVNNEATAEKIFSYLDNYKGVISYDTETSGLRINMFGKIGSSRKKELEDYNAAQRAKNEEEIRVDYLVGIIFCVENDVSYYFPCSNRKFKNLYSNVEDPVTKRTIELIKAKYTVADYRNRTDDMARYIRNTPANELGCDVILMERCREIISKGHILAHNGAFEWKVGWLYNIDTNLRDDTMILHQLMYKFRTTTSNRGEPSNLKYLSKVELGVDQLDLKDFFVDFEEDNSKGEIRSRSSGKGKKKKGSSIDFSWMDYEGSRCYAPADGDLTLQLFLKYKRDLIENHKDLEYLYSVEVLVACAVGYMEFYGHRLDEDKIEEVRETNFIHTMDIEYQFRELNNMISDKEKYFHTKIIKNTEVLKSLDKELAELQSKVEDDGIKTKSKEYLAAESKKIEIKGLIKETVEICKNLRKEIDGGEKPFNLASPAQVADLIYNKYNFQPDENGKKSVGKKVLKQYLKVKNADGTDKYPDIVMYTEWKKLDTLLTKFFDNLQYFMYPGGFIFSSFGQISTATGRMSCSKPNAQQYPKDITAIVIPREGFIMLDADFSQIEYRTLVAMANEPGLLEKFKNPDNDYHTMMASLMYGVPYASVTPKMRSDAKSFNFGIPYGMGFRSLAILLTGRCGVSEVEEAKEKYELYFKDQPNVRTFFNAVKEMALVNKYTKTKWGRVRHYSFVDKDGNFSQARRAMALRQAGNAVIQGTAADIFKISVARNFTYIRQNGLLGLLLIINMIHDEQLMEINYEQLNVQRVLRDVVANMQMKIDGFPPLFVGAGISDSWASAKGSMAEIHPNLASQLSREADNMSVWAQGPTTRKQWLEYFNKRVYDFRVQKVVNYLNDTSNYGKDLHPAIGNLINLQFTYGLKDKYSGEELTTKSLEKFIEMQGLGIDYRLFSVHSEQAVVEEEEDTEYEDNEDEDIDEMEGSFIGREFALVDEDMSLYGVALQDIIKQFGLIVSKEKRVCGVDVTILPYKMKDELADYLTEHNCEADDPDGVQVVFLRENNILFETGVWVKGVNGSVMSAKLGLNSILYR